MTLKISLLIVFICTSGCSTLYETSQFIPKPVSDSAATVYLYRPSAMSNATYSPELFVNDEYKLSIKNRQHSSMTLPPGGTVFNIGQNKNYSGVTQLSVNLLTGKTYYIRVDTSLKLDASTNYEPYQRTFNLTMVDEALATQQIEKCCLTKKKVTTKQKPLPNTKKLSDEGFSVDKTQNPFSH